MLRVDGVQMDHDGGVIRWYGVGGNVPLELEVQRTLKRANISVFFMALWAC